MESGESITSCVWCPQRASARIRCGCDKRFATERFLSLPPPVTPYCRPQEALPLPSPAVLLLDTVLWFLLRSSFPVLGFFFHRSSPPTSGCDLLFCLSSSKLFVDTFAACTATDTQTYMRVSLDTPPHHGGRSSVVGACQKWVPPLLILPPPPPPVTKSLVVPPSATYP